nr:unnamed protein product [Spirometra erinaceieuropaei]
MDAYHQDGSADNLPLRNLDIGPCIAEGDAYCTRRVANSVCSPTKNECFCQPSFVAIQEEYGITCKPLLTSLTCRVDKDCVHVRNSICHPGAGFCACPGGTVYVSQSHTCQSVVEKHNNSFCQKCRQVNGVCFWQESAADSKANENARQVSESWMPSWRSFLRDLNR